MVKKGTWVLIESVVLSAKDRAEHLPEDTRATDLKKWVKGYLNRNAEIGEPASVTTVTGREENGVLVEANPINAVDYGSFVPELKRAGESAKAASRKAASGEGGL